MKKTDNSDTGCTHMCVTIRQFLFYLTQFLFNFLILYDENAFQNNKITCKIKQEQKQDLNKSQGI